MRVTAYNANGARVVDWEVNHAGTLAAQMFAHDIDAIDGYAVDGVGIFTTVKDARGKLTGFRYLAGSEFTTVSDKRSLAVLLSA